MEASACRGLRGHLSRCEVRELMPLRPWEISLGLVCFAVAVVALAVLSLPALVLYVVGTAASALLYRWRGESFAEGWATGAVCWPLSVPFAIWGLRT